MRPWRPLIALLATLGASPKLLVFSVGLGALVGVFLWQHLPTPPRAIVSSPWKDWNPSMFGAHDLFFSASGDVLFTIVITRGHGSEICSWDVATREKLQALYAGEKVVHSFELAPDGSSAAALAEDTITFWDLRTGKAQTVPIAERLKEEREFAFTYAADGRLLALILREEAIHVVDAVTGAERTVWDFDRAELRFPAFDAGWVITGGQNRLFLRHVPTGGPATVVPAPLGPVPGIRMAEVSITTDGRLLVVPSSLGMDVIETSTGNLRSVPDLYPLAISSDGRYVGGEGRPDEGSPPWWRDFLNWLGLAASEGEDRITLIDLASNRPTATWTGVVLFRFSPDGTRLAVVGNDGAIRVYELPLRRAWGTIVGFAALAAAGLWLAGKALGWLFARLGRLRAARTQPGGEMCGR